MSTKQCSNGYRDAGMTCWLENFPSAKHSVLHVTIKINVKGESEPPHFPPHATHLAGVWAHNMSEGVTQIL